MSDNAEEKLTDHVAVQSRPDRFRSLDRNRFDVIIVGAGTGGLTAGSLLNSGDYAEPPSRASLMLHATVTAGYLSGAYYPAGGGQTLSNRLAESIERQGGKILLRAPVTKIAKAGRFHPQPFCFMPCSSLKDPDNPQTPPDGHSNLELVTVVPSQPEAWGTTVQEMADGTYEKNPIYLQTKQELADRLLSAAERVLPDLRRDVDCCEVSSPMTHTRFTGSSGGTSYGIALIPKQFLFHRPGPATEIGGLYICGASAMAGHGIPGAVWSGVLAASRIVGNGVLKEVMMTN